MTDRAFGLDNYTDISTESYREYDFGNGVVIRIDSPEKLHVSRSGGHRILDSDGVSHYIPFKWVHLSWESTEGEPAFIV